jgi:hypothetical protein
MLSEAKNLLLAPYEKQILRFAQNDEIGAPGRRSGFSVSCSQSQGDGIPPLTAARLMMPT